MKKAAPAPDLSSIIEDLRPLAVPIESLTRDPRNARMHDDRNLGSIMRSLERFGQRKPVVVNRRTGTLLAGNGTLTAALGLGWTHLAAVNVDDDPATATGYAVADNRTAELAEWDDAQLAELLQELEGTDVSLGDVGFSAEELGELLDGIEAETGEATPEAEAPKPPRKPRSKPGKVYRLGPHRLLCGDSTDAALIAKLYGEEKARLLWTDPPYGVSYSSKNEMLNTFDKGNRNQTPIEGDDAKPEEVEALVQAALSAIPRVEGAAIYVACANQLDLQVATIQGVTAAGFLLRWNLVWTKDNHVLGRADYLAKHETLLYGWATDGPHLFNGHHRQSTFEVPRPRSSPDHPTMKPVALIEPMLLNSSHRGEIVADPFGGSGSTLLAAARTGRRCFTSELTPGYCDVIRKRWGAYAREAGVDPGPDAL